jgi:hypothetical protein
MPSSSPTKSQRLSWASSHLVLAEAILDLQVRVNAITQELAPLRKPISGPRCRPINLRGLADALMALREILSTPAMQALITGLLPMLAALARWLLRWLVG